MLKLKQKKNFFCSFVSNSKKISFKKRNLHSTSFGIAFDADGVLKRSPNPIKGVKEMLSTFVDPKTKQLLAPFVICTNGGGNTEEEVAKSFSKILEFEIPPSTLILSHTPMKSLVEKYGNELVLIGGRGNPTQAAKKYGFNKAMSIETYASFHPTMYPFLKFEAPKDENLLQISKEPVKAIMIYSDPIYWGLEIQIIIDILTSNGNPLHEIDHQIVSLYYSNPDFTWSSVYPRPRFAQASFHRSVAVLHKELTGREVKATCFGKPTIGTFKFAENVLNQQIQQITGDKTKKIDYFYMIGDNPKSDIRGANNAKKYGEKWTSVLVKTGLFRGKNDETDPADIVCEDVVEAVELIRKRHKN